MSRRASGLRPLRAFDEVDVTDLLGVLDGLATDASVAASGITTFVMLYCGLNWWTYRCARIAAEDDASDDDV